MVDSARSADIDESAIGDRTSDPADLVLKLGLAKAEALLPSLKSEAERGMMGTTLLLTGDQGTHFYILLLLLCVRSDVNVRIQCIQQIVPKRCHRLASIFCLDVVDLPRSICSVLFFN